MGNVKAYCRMAGAFVHSVGNLQEDPLPPTPVKQGDRPVTLRRRVAHRWRLLPVITGWRSMPY
jgi:hypothetical protein